MPELKLGTKFECFSCGTKFYDLGKSEPICPKCKANQKDVVQAENTAASQAARRKRKAELAKNVEVDEEEVASGDAVDDEILETDLEGLGGDDEEEEFEDDEE
jgi:uncharacterized protein (TIGR02300 family)